MQQKACLACGELFFKTSNQPQKYWETKRKYCSNRCKVLGKPSPKKGKQFPHLWKGKVGYGALHLRVRKVYGRPRKCIECGSGKNVQWANKSNEYKDENDFIELCASCHKKYDSKANKRVAWNKGLKGREYKKHYSAGIKGPPKGNTPWNKSNARLVCPTCNKEFHTNPSEIKAGKRFCSKECYRKPSVEK